MSAVSRESVIKLSVVFTPATGRPYFGTLRGILSNRGRNSLTCRLFSAFGVGRSTMDLDSLDRMAGGLRVVVIYRGAAVSGFRVYVDMTSPSMLVLF